MRTFTPRQLGNFDFLSDYGQSLEAKHIPAHDFIELWVDDSWIVFKHADKAKAADFARFLLEWAEES